MPHKYSMTMAVVQARMTSHRLPGKVMRPIMGKPAIGYLLDRLKRAKNIDKIVVAVTDLSDDDLLCEYITSLGFSTFRGSESDVLGRLFEAARKDAATSVVRITGDCILIEPTYCDLLIERFQSEGVDYAYLSPKFAEGLDCEVMRFSVLEKLHRLAKRPSEREHVTLYLHNHKSSFTTFMLDQDIDDSKYRLALDEPEDLRVITLLIEQLWPVFGASLDFLTIKKYLDDNSAVMHINSHIVRNEGLQISLRKEQLLD